LFEEVLNLINSQEIGNIDDGLQPVIILVDPQLGENIGASARGMWNFGLKNLRLVNPRDGWPNPKAGSVAAGGGIVLDNVKVYSDLQNAVKDLDYVFATSIRHRDLDKNVSSLEKAMEKTQNLFSRDMKVGIMFGPERSGLENKHISIANSIISIPVNPKYGSLNLGQSVLLTGYEWLRSKSREGDAAQSKARSNIAGQGDVEKFHDHLVDSLQKISFFFPEEKSNSMRINLRNMLSRMPLTNLDIRILHGILRQFDRWKSRK
jgi:tRNA/rRNA methyltransferase